jgi:hypothetical protein
VSSPSTFSSFILSLTGAPAAARTHFVFVFSGKLMRTFSLPFILWKINNDTSLSLRFKLPNMDLSLGTLMRVLARIKAAKEVSSECNTELVTEDVTLASHTHGRERRAERNIQRRELQAAIKYGRKEAANPGRDGSVRWRYTYNGVVYITDETSRHEATSWRLDEEGDNAIGPDAIDLDGRGAHAVLIVDHSGSMHKEDVSGYKSRLDAVYDCLSREFVDAQLAQSESTPAIARDVVVSLISTSDDAEVLIDRHPLEATLSSKLKSLRKRRPKSQGNYIPALNKALEMMVADAPNRANFLLLFLSDGAPSDHTVQCCKHGQLV